MNTYERDEIMGNFRDERYANLNKARWDHFLSMGIPIRGQSILELGAGIGDQTEWLLDHGAKWIYVIEGRSGNCDIIHDRFDADSRVWVVNADLEGDLPKFETMFDLIFCYGVYYHLREDKDFTIMRQLSRLGEMIAFDYLSGNDNEVHYGYDNPSTSISQFAHRPRRETMNAALKSIWEYAYEPKEPLQWVDPRASEDRVVAVASHSRLDNPNLIQI